jgi:hypothetical protein
MMRICLYTRISTGEENQPTSLASPNANGWRRSARWFARRQVQWAILGSNQ